MKGVDAGACVRLGKQTTSYQKMVNAMRQMAVRALIRMYRPERRLFGFRIRRTRYGNMLKGISRRYTAISLIGLAGESRETVGRVLAGQDIFDVAGSLIEEVQGTRDLGEAALAVWASRLLGHSQAGRAIMNLETMTPVNRDCPMVELAWCLSSLTAGGMADGRYDLTKSIAERVKRSFHESSSLFPHRPIGSTSSRWRGHIGCFADQVYPIQALSFYYQQTGDKEALAIARKCAEKICEKQGQYGQWCWHYDVRNGEVVETYPVYSVHQDGMAPMALLELQRAGGGDYSACIDRGLKWLADPPEQKTPLIDEAADLIWRKIARYEPRRLARGLQAIASRVHPQFRFPGVDRVLVPGAIDYESRPYHMGWILYAWPKNSQEKETN